jgi:hypothetical protein
MLRRAARVLSSSILIVAFGSAFGQSALMPSTAAAPPKKSNSQPSNLNPNPEVGTPPLADLGKAMFQAAAPDHLSKIVDGVSYANDAKEIVTTGLNHGASDAAVATLQKGVDAAVEKGVAITGEALGLPAPVADREAKVVTSAGRYIRDNTKLGRIVQDTEYDAAVATGKAVIKASDAAGKAFSGSEFDLTGSVNPSFDKEASHALGTVEMPQNGSVANLSGALKADADQQAAIARAQQEADRQTRLAQLAEEKQEEQDRIAQAKEEREEDEEQEQEDEQEQADREQRDEDREARREEREAREESTWQAEQDAWQAQSAWQAQAAWQAAWASAWQQQADPNVYSSGSVTTPSTDYTCDTNAAVRAVRPSPGDTSGMQSLSQNLETYCATPALPPATQPADSLPSSSVPSASVPSSPSSSSPTPPSSSSGSTQ